MSANVTIKTYADFDRWVDAFLKPDGLNLLFAIGNPGTAKSTSFKSRLNLDQHHYINAARLTAFQLYRQLFAVRNKAIVFDDVDDALRHATTARLLMAVCETDEGERSVAWLGTQSLLKVNKGKKIVKIPPEFTTTSRICLICNDWGILTRKFGALLDRGTVLFFDPDEKEIHSFVGKWFQDKEIFEFIGERLDEIPQHSVRYYVLASDHKRLGLDWRAVLRESWTTDEVQGDATEKLVQQLLADPNLKTDKERIKAFESHPYGGKRRTWYNLKKKIGLKRKSVA